MDGTASFLRVNAAKLIALADVAVLAAVFYCIPLLRRPLEILAVAVAVLGFATAMAVKRAWLQYPLLVVASVGLSVFVLEMGEKYFKITDFFAAAPESLVPIGGDYRWNNTDTKTYVAARARALRDGLGPEAAFAADFAGDIFAADPRVIGWRHEVRAWGCRIRFDALKEDSIKGPPLGFEATPDNLLRHYCFDEESGTMLFDGAITVDARGLRPTRGDPDADDIFIFMGCSFMFGYGLGDEQTLPHYFSERFGFAKNVLNFGFNLNGPHQVLRDLGLDYHGERANVDPAKVRAVYVNLIDDHARRVLMHRPESAPYYVIEDGRAVYRGTFMASGFADRFHLLLERDRLYPALRAKLGTSKSSRNLDLMHAILVEADRICREKYGVPMTIIYQDDDPAMVARARADGLEVISMEEICGDDWRLHPIRYRLWDLHPSAYGNEVLADRLYEHARQRVAADR